jgi:hypothetical protein
MSLSHKATISVWFRYSDGAPGGSDTDLTLSNIVPIIAWGRPSAFTTTVQSSGNTFVERWLEGPSFIGINTASGASNLAIRFHSGNRCSIRQQPNPDVSFTQQGCNYFAIGVQDSIGILGGTTPYSISVDRGVWHHLMVSFDIPDVSGNVNIILDGTQFLGPSLWPAGLNSQGEAGGRTEIRAYYDWPYWPRDEFTTVSSSGFTFQTSGVGVPVPGGLVSHRSGHIQLAALYIFNNVMTDDNGLFLTRFGKPQPINVAIDALGTPSVLLYPQTDWIQHHNSGSGGRLSGAPTITHFKPEPKIGA